MSFDPIPIEFSSISKKYSRDAVFHRSIREDISSIFHKGSQNEELARNEFWALRNVTLSVRAGETVGLYGPNGSGKSTILKLIANVTFPTQGRLRVHGRIAPLIEIGAGFHPDLSGRENVFVNGAILGMRIGEIRERLASIIGFSEIGDFVDMPVKKYSSGMYLRLAFSIAVHSDADIFLIDEILAVGDKAFRAKCLERIREFKRRGKTILIVSHDTQHMEEFADRVIHLERGVLLE